MKAMDDGGRDGEEAARTLDTGAARTGGFLHGDGDVGRIELSGEMLERLLLDVLGVRVFIGCRPHASQYSMVWSCGRAPSVTVKVAPVGPRGHGGRG